MSERQARRWAVAERWKERLEATQRKAARLAVDKDADRLARIALRHRKGARAIQQYALGFLSGGTMVIDPRTSRPYLNMKADGAAGGFECRPLLPAELNQATQAFVKAAELEYGRAGGKTGSNEVDRRFPDLVELLTKVNAERAAAAKLKSAGSGSTIDLAYPKDDPRFKALAERTKHEVDNRGKT